MGRAVGPFLGNLGIAVSSLGPYTHIAIVVAVDTHRPERSEVVEATRFQGERVTPLAEFLRFSIYAGLVRPDVDEAGRRAAAAYALAQRGLPYDETFGLDDPLHPGRPAAPAGHYCSGLIWSAYRAAGFDIAGGRRTVYRRLPLRVARRLYNLMPERDLVLPNDIFYALLRRQAAPAPSVAVDAQPRAVARP